MTTMRRAASMSKVLLGRTRDLIPNNSKFPRKGTLNDPYIIDWDVEMGHHCAGIRYNISLNLERPS